MHQARALISLLRCSVEALAVPAAMAITLASCATAPSPPPQLRKEKISAGDEPHLPDSFDAPSCGNTLRGSYRMCISQQGRVSSVDLLHGIPGADEQIVATLHHWRYKPVAIPLCFVQNLEFRIDCKKPEPRSARRPDIAANFARSSAPLWVSALVMDRQKLSSDDEPQVPSPVAQLTCGGILSGTYQTCVSESGKVSSVEVVSGIVGADASILEAIKRWRYQAQLAPVCFLKRIEFRAPCPSDVNP